MFRSDRASPSGRSEAGEPVNPWSRTAPTGPPSKRNGSAPGTIRALTSFLAGGVPEELHHDEYGEQSGGRDHDREDPDERPFERSVRQQPRAPVARATVYSAAGSSAFWRGWVSGLARGRGPDQCPASDGALLAAHLHPTGPAGRAEGPPLRTHHDHDPHGLTHRAARQ